MLVSLAAISDFMRKLYVVGGQLNYARWMQSEIVHSIPEADLVCFVGGEDVSPQLYGANPHPFTSCNVTRDTVEAGKFTEALALGKKIVGVCRGAQFICVQSGGKLVQHMSHPSIHPMITAEGTRVTVTSSHHQAQYPWGISKEGVDWRLLGWTLGLSPFHEGESRDDELCNATGTSPALPEVEVAVYHKTNALAIQSHPEWQELSSPPIDYFRRLLDKHMNGDLG